jgi:acid phosphatase family membrane protein YuiD
VVFEATGLRQEVGHQARLLNDLVENLRHRHPVGQQHLREFVGHTWAEVAGGAACGVAFALPFVR